MREEKGPGEIGAVLREAPLGEKVYAALIKRARWHLAAGHKEDALRDLKTAQKLAPEWAETYLEEAKIYKADGNLTAALAAEAREDGQIVFNETCPQYLLLDNTLYAGSEPWRYILQPPLRDPEERERLWALVGAGLVDMLVTDHCDYTQAQKRADDDFTRTPGGLPGLETLLPLMATYGVGDGRIDWPDLVRLLAANPARIYNLWPRKGALLPGSDADIVLYDPTPTGTITAENLHSLAGYTPYEGLRVQGRVVATLRRGAFLVRAGAFVGSEGSGVYLPRAPRFW